MNDYNSKIKVDWTIPVAGIYTTGSPVYPYWKEGLSSGSDHFCQDVNGIHRFFLVHPGEAHPGCVEG